MDGGLASHGLGPLFSHAIGTGRSSYNVSEPPLPSRIISRWAATRRLTIIVPLRLRSSAPRRRPVPSTYSAPPPPPPPRGDGGGGGHPLTVNSKGMALCAGFQDGSCPEKRAGLSQGLEQGPSVLAVWYPRTWRLILSEARSVFSNTQAWRWRQKVNGEGLTRVGARDGGRCDTGNS